MELCLEEEEEKERQREKVDGEIFIRTICHLRKHF